MKRYELAAEGVGATSHQGHIAWSSGLAGFEDLAVSMPPGAVVTAYTDASSADGRGATLGGEFFLGGWPQQARREGVN